MDYRKFNHTIIARIDKGEEILEKIKEIALKENIKLANINALGATNKFKVGVFKVDEKSTIRMNLKETLKSFLSQGQSIQ